MKTHSKQARFLMSGVRFFLRNNELSDMTIQNEYGAISVRRERTPKTAISAVGFRVNDVDREDDEEEDYDE